MCEKRYTKGKKEVVISRINNIHTITFYCPLQDYGVYCLKTILENYLLGYKCGDNMWERIPTIDCLNEFSAIVSFGKDKEDFDLAIVRMMSSSLRMFKNLKYISFEFYEDEELMDMYNSVFVDGNVSKIYNIDAIELNLTDLFSQEIVDFFNRVLVLNGIISNSYLERNFYIDFTFDEYVSFVNMLLNNNHQKFQEMDENICDYFSMFPNLITEQKPKVRIITNYQEL